LDKYGRSPPSTWDELMEIASYIISKEKEENNNIIGYIGHMPEHETSVCSSLEFIYSFRDNVNDTLPSFKSSNAKNAFDTIKKLKDEFSNDNAFKASDYSIVQNVLRNEVLFARFWENSISTMNYYATHIPGNKKGISASCINGMNIGINKYIKEEQQIAAGNVLEFFFSEMIQRDLVINYKKTVALKKMYNDDELCKYLENDQISMNCEVYENLQYFLKPLNLIDTYVKYSVKYRDILNSFLYKGTRNSEEALEDIYNISHVYDIKITSWLGIFVVLIIIFSFLVIIVSYIMIIQKKNKIYFKFLRNRYWLLFMCGLMIVNIYPLVGLNKLSRFKCYIRPILISEGFTISFTPILLKIIVNFPLKNKISSFINQNFFVFILIFVLIDIISFIFYSMSPLVVQTYYVEDGLNFQYCVSYSEFGKTVIMLLIGYKSIILLILALFLFMEWNLEETREDIRSFISILYINILSITLYIIIYYIDIKNYYIYYILRVAPIYCYTITNYVMVIGLRILSSRLKEDNDQDILEKVLFKQASYNVGATRTNPKLILKGNNNDLQKKGTVKNLMMNFHFSTGRSSAIKDEEFLSTMSSSSSGSEGYPSQTDSTKSGEFNKNCINFRTFRKPSNLK
jgi:hypothetical protein